MTETVSAAFPDFLSGGGEMGRLTREYDWASSPLGAPDAWPQSLRTVVRLLLSSSHPMFIWWGPRLIQFYNDAYQQIIGSQRHPAALGQEGRQCWDEIWPIIGPQIAQVLAGQGAVWHENALVPITRNGRLEDVYWTYSYSPIDDRSAPNGVGGVLVICTETTAAVLQARRLASEREEFARLFEQAPSFMAMLRGPEHRFEMANPAYLRLVGHRPLIGKTAAEALPEVAAQGYLALLDQVYRSGQAHSAVNSKVWLQPAEGGAVVERYIDFVYQPIRDAQAKVWGIFVEGFDVTARALAEIQLRDLNADLERQVVERSHERVTRVREVAESRMAFALEASDMGAWDLDLLTGESVRSPRHDACFGYSEPLSHWTYEEFLAHVHPEHRARVDASFQAASTGARVWDVECPVIWPDQSVHWVASRARTEVDEAGQPVRMAGIVWDTTATHAVHEALRQADRQKDEFLATLAHELRNPLAPIRNAAHVLGKPELSARDVGWCRDVITRQVQHMALLLDDLLEVSRITTGRIELRPETVPLDRVVQSAVETARPLITQKRHALEVVLPAVPAAVQADALRLGQILGNLLTNAAKYTDPGGRIDLKAEVDGQGLVVSVRDNGIGLSQQAQEGLFRMFSQVPAAQDRSEGGLGIGLALSRGLAQLHGGTLTVHSEGPGLGSTFRLWLPLDLLRPVQAAETQQPGNVDQPAERRAIMVVDDNRDAADTLAMLIETQGHDVAVAYSGEDGLVLGRRRRPQLAILDIGMPGMDGYELARRIRGEAWGRNTLLVAATGWGQKEDEDRARAAGFDQHLTKPLDPDAVFALLAQLPLPQPGQDG